MKIKKRVIVYDDGNFIHIAIELSKYFDSVGYYCPHETAFPRSNNAWVGKGIDEIEWIDEFWTEVPKADLFVFPDCRYAALQVYLRSIGKQVFGSGEGIELENNRLFANKFLEEIGLPSVKMKPVKGMDKFREYLKEHDDLYIKCDYRGDGETWHHTNYKLSEPKLDEIEHELGILKRDYVFLCCSPIDGDDIVEIGSDSYFIDGKYPQTVMIGYEVKDLGYLGAVRKRSMLSKIVTGPLDKISPMMEEYQYRNFFSTEIRVGKDRKPYLTDFTCRCGSPPSELYVCMLKNLGEIVDKGSQGILVEPEYSAKYGAQAIITSEWAEKNWLPLQIPDKIKDHVKVKNLCKIDGVSYYIPINDVEMCQVGSVIATGNTLDAAIEKLNEISKHLEGFKIEVNTGSINKAMEVINGGKKLGINF